MARINDVSALLILFSLSLLVWLPRFHGPADLRWDAGVYYILGTSLAEGKGYRILSEPGEMEAIQYPPMLPALVAAHERVLGTTDPAIVGQWLRRTFFILFVIYTLGSYALARSFFSPGYALLATLPVPLYLFSIYLSDLLFAELPFALMTVAFLLIQRWLRGLARFTASGIVGAAAYLTRTAGIVLLVAWVGESLLRRQWGQAIARTGLALIPVLAWQSHIARVMATEEFRQPDYAYQRAPYMYYNVSYAENLKLFDSFRPEKGNATWKQWVRRIGDNLLIMPVSLGEGVGGKRGYWYMLVDRFLDPWELSERLPDWLLSLPLWPIGGMIMVGLALLTWRGEWLIPLYVAGAVFLMCITPWDEQFPRYMAPLTPLLAIALIVTLTAFRDLAQNRLSGQWQEVGTAVFATTMILIIAANVYSAQYEFRESARRNATWFYYDRTWKEFDEAMFWLKPRMAPGEIAATWVPHWFYIWTGHQAVMPPMEANLATGQRFLDSVPARYVIVDELDFLNLGGVYTEPMLRRYSQQWELIYSSANRKTRIYRRQ